MASVRFICGTQTLHKQLEERLSAFLGTEDTILFTPASTRTAASSRRCSAPTTPSSPTRSTTPRSSTGSGSARRSAPLRERRPGELEARLVRGSRRAHPDDRDRRRLLDGRPHRRPRRHLRPRRAPRRARHGRRLPRRRLRRAERPRHARAARGHGAGRHRHGHARQGDGRRLRRLRLGPPRDRRAAAPARAAVPLLEQRRPADRRGRAEGDRARRGLARVA